MNGKIITISRNYSPSLVAILASIIFLIDHLHHLHQLDFKVITSLRRSNTQHHQHFDLLWDKGCNVCHSEAHKCRRTCFFHVLKLQYPRKNATFQKAPSLPKGGCNRQKTWKHAQMVVVFKWIGIDLTFLVKALVYESWSHNNQKLTTLKTNTGGENRNTITER